MSGIKRLALAGSDDGGSQVIDGIRMPTTITLRPVAELIPYAANSRDHSPAQVAELAEHIKRYGWTNPVLVADGGILAGHGRIMAAQKLGVSRVPCLDLSHLTPEERRAYVIWDNRSAEKSSWNLEALKLETDELRGLGLDLEAVTGWAEDDLADLFRGLPEVPEVGAATDPDALPPEDAGPVSEAGDVWRCGAHAVACGDCRDPAVVDALMGGEMADVAWCDPPYLVDLDRKNRLMDEAVGGNRSKSGRIANDKMTEPEFAEFLRASFTAMLERLQPGACIYVAHSDKAGVLFRSAFEAVGFKFHQNLIWRKNNHVVGFSKHQPIHEPIMFGYKPGSKQRWYGGRSQTTVVEAGEGGPIKQLADGRWVIQVGDSVLVVSGDAKLEEAPGSVVSEPRPAKSELHPSQKPVSLVERQLRNAARRGDLVLDFFGGSGSTLVAADRLGMSARLIELDPGHTDTIVRRWQMLTGRRAVHAVTGIPFPADGEVRAAPVVDPAGPVDPADDEPF